MEEETAFSTEYKCRLFRCLVVKGTQAAEKVLVDNVLNHYLNQTGVKNKVEKCVETDIYRYQFEKLYPTNGHIPTLSDFEEVLKEFIHKKILKIREPYTGSEGLEKHFRTVVLNEVLKANRISLLKVHQRLKPEQWKKIDPDFAEVKISNLDISLLCCVIRNAFPKKRPTNGKWDKMPAPDALTIEDDLCRMWQLRNKVAHYRSPEEILSEEDFSYIWTELTQVFSHLLPQDLNETREIREMRYGPIDYTFSQQCEEIIDKWVKEDLETKEEIKNYISQTSNDLARQTSLVVEGSEKKLKAHTCQVADLATKDIVSAAEKCMDKMEEKTSEIIQNAVTEITRHTSATSISSIEDTKVLVENCVTQMVQNIESSEREIIEQTSHISNITKQQMISEVEKCIQTAVQQIESKTSHIISDAANEAKAHLSEIVGSAKTEMASIAREMFIAANKNSENLILQYLEQYKSHIVDSITTVFQKKIPDIDNVKKFLENVIHKSAEEAIQKVSKGRDEDTDQDDTKNRKRKPTDPMTLEVKNWSDNEKCFFPTKALQEILTVLDSRKFVTVVGPPMSGKTMTARHIALRYQKEGYDVFPVSDPEGIERYMSVQGRQVFIVDDPFGKSAIDRKRFDAWQRFDERLRTCLKEADIILISTVNSHLVKEQMFRRSCLLFGEQQVDICAEKLKLTAEERSGMVSRYLQASVIDDTKTHDKVRESAKSCEFFFFPAICQNLKLNAKTLKQPAQIFKYPFELLTDFFSKVQFDNKYLFGGLCICAFFENMAYAREDSFSRDCLKVLQIGEGKQERIQSALQSVQHIWVENTRERNLFTHEVVRDVILLLMGKKAENSFDVENSITSKIIQKMPSQVLRERVKIFYQDYEEISEEYLLYIGNEHWKCFSLRLCGDILMETPNILTDSVLHTKHTDPKYECHILKWLRQADQLPDSTVKPLVLLAIQTEHTDLLEILLPKISDLNFHYTETCTYDFALQSEGCSPLHFAVNILRYKTVDVLSKHGADVNMLTADGVTPLHLAVTKRDKGMVSLLLQCGANINKLSRKGLSPMHLAVELQCEEMIRHLHSKRAAMNTCMSCEGCLPLLHIAVSRQNKEILKLLLELGASCYEIDCYGYPALHFAINQGHVEIAMVLLEYKYHKTPMEVNNFSSESCRHPLNIAVFNGNIPMVTELLKSGKIEMNTPDSDTGMTPLHIAVQSKSLEIATLLLTYGADITLKDKRGQTPKAIAMKEGHQKILSFLEAYENDKLIE